MVPPRFPEPIKGGAARLVGVDARTSRRWALNEIPVPGAVQRLLWACERDPELLRLLRDEWRDDGDDSADKGAAT